MGKLMASQTLQQELRLRAAHTSANHLLQLLGYKCPSTKHRERLANVLNDPVLERVHWISRLVITHYQLHQGKLGIWGGRYSAMFTVTRKSER